jgi:hypothetical protein
MKGLIHIILIMIGLIFMIISMIINLFDEKIGLLHFIGLIGLFPLIIGIFITIRQNRIKKHQIQLLKDEKLPLSPFSRYSVTKDDLDIVNKNLDILKYKISNISYKKLKIEEYNKLLVEDIEKNKISNDIYSKNSIIIVYLSSFYDKYTALYLEAFFSRLMFYINKNKKTLDIKSTIDMIKDEIIQEIKKYIPYNESIDEIKNTYENSGNVIERIFNDIDKLKLQLVSFQSESIYSSISPIKNEGEYNLVKYISSSENIIIDIISLINEYDRFHSEYEVTEENNATQGIRHSKTC